jgi:hypothetical protein
VYFWVSVIGCGQGCTYLRPYTHTSQEWITCHGHPPTFNWAINMYRMSLNKRAHVRNEGGTNTSVTWHMNKRNTKFVYLYANSPQFDQLEETKHQIFTTQVPTPLYILSIHRWTVFLISSQNHPIRSTATNHSHSHFQVQNILNHFYQWILHRITAMLKLISSINHLYRVATRTQIIIVKIPI